MARRGRVLQTPCLVLFYLRYALETCQRSILNCTRPRLRCLLMSWLLKSMIMREYVLVVVNMLFCTESRSLAGALSR
jgi:hypothetical protein